MNDPITIKAISQIGEEWSIKFKLKTKTLFALANGKEIIDILNDYNVCKALTGKEIWLTYSQYRKLNKFYTFHKTQHHEFKIIY